MAQAAGWLARLQTDSQRKLGDVSAMIQADAEAAKAWIAYAAELSNGPRNGIQDAPPPGYR